MEVVMTTLNRFLFTFSLMLILVFTLAGMTNAELVRSGNFIVDPATYDPTNPPSLTLNTDEEMLSNAGFETGNLPPWTTSGGWQISTNGPHTGVYCAYDVGNNWIRQDITPTQQSQILSATLWMRQPEAQISAIDFMYANGQYSEDLIWLTTSWTQYNLISFIDPGQTVIAIRIWGYSGGPPQQDETFLDDVSIQTAGGAVGVEITITPVNPPIVIPPSGGSFNFNATITNNDPIPRTFGSWCMVTLPNGQTYGPVLQIAGITLPGGASISRVRTQLVPGSAPAGLYNYIAYVGSYPSVIYDSSFFPFTKSGVDLGDNFSSWENSGDAFDPGSILLLPTDFAVLGNYPNPFNPTTTIEFALPTASYVSLTIFNSLGQEVAALVNEKLQAGTYKTEWNASTMSSGVYMYRIVAKDFMQVRKMLLLR